MHHGHIIREFLTQSVWTHIVDMMFRSYVANVLVATMIVVNNMGKSIVQLALLPAMSHTPIHNMEWIDVE